ncbi:MAG: SufD family Fe-S cluster assembly protein [Bacilli bacterium]|jgi:Fe-S cluster assembly protein SufD|nr:SufD family Fe-S cluster assembly protein [Bacilli bacterium]
MENNIRQINLKECQNQEHVVDFNEDFSGLEINVGKRANLALNIINLGIAKNMKIVAKIEENGEISAVMADFSSGKGSLDVDINLVGINAKGTWRLSALSSNRDDKKYDVHFNHHAQNTYGLMDNYGVARDSSRLVFSGANEIFRGAKQSKTKQNAKIIVFDEGAIAKANPRLNIDENEVEASHAAVVGKLSDDHLFYLMSRGLNLNEAKRLITYGYLLPIANYFHDDSLKEKIAKIIEEHV